MWRCQNAKGTLSNHSDCHLFAQRTYRARSFRRRSDVHTLLCLWSRHRTAPLCLERRPCIQVKVKAVPRLRVAALLTREHALYQETGCARNAYLSPKHNRSDDTKSKLTSYVNSVITNIETNKICRLKKRGKGDSNEDQL